MHDVHLQHLSPGTLIEHYELKDVLGVGGFGITYKGWDTRLERWVAIKEFLPAELAVRDAASRTVKARTDRAGDYEFALEKFLQEARILAKFDHVNIVRATAFLQANGTGYMVMDYVQGRSLSEYLKSHPGPVPQETLKSWFVPILKGLVEVHKAGFLHRDIKPGNIYLRDGGEPLLIDFGAARQAIGEHSRSVTGIVSAGYAPTEQYSSNASKQGPWSDLYALGATMYRCIAGDDPVDAPSRQNARVEDEPDPLLPAIEVGAGRYDDAVLQMIDHLLQLPIKARPQSAHSVLEALITDTPSGNDSLQGSTALEGTRVVSDEERRAMEAPPAQETASPSRKDGLWLAAALLVTALGAGAYWMLANNGSTVDDAAPPVVVQSTAPVTSTPVSTATTLTRDELLSGSAIVRIDSDPSGATVRLDDVEIGTTPFESKRVKDGTYALSLSTPYTAPYREEVTLRPNRVVSRSIELSTAQGEITVLSDPPGARILIDGSETNRVTPATLEGIDAGERTIRVSLERYEVAEQSVEVVPSRVALIDTPLNPMAYGRLTLDLSPKDAQVLLPDIGPGYTPGMELPVGEYRVQVSARNHADFAGTILVTRNQHRATPISLERTAGTLFLSGLPSQATVTLTNQKTNRTATYQFGVTLAYGSYRLEVRAPRYEDLTTTIAINAAINRQALAIVELPLAEQPGKEFQDTLRSGGQGPEMVVLPTGSFRMGDLSGDGDGDEIPVHRVTISNPIAMGKYEVTFADYDRFAQATSHRHIEDSDWGRGRRPVISVRWIDAVAYARWLSTETGKRYRLPSESEWEYAARAGTQTRYGWGDSVGRNQANCFGCGSRWDSTQTAPVGSFAANAFGLYDMHGNVWEWVEDCFEGGYGSVQSNDPAQDRCSDTSRRVLRGGSWFDSPAKLRSSNRHWISPYSHRLTYGFRLVQDLGP